MLYDENLFWVLNPGGKTNMHIDQNCSELSSGSFLTIELSPGSFLTSELFLGPCRAWSVLCCTFLGPCRVWSVLCRT